MRTTLECIRMDQMIHQLALFDLTLTIIYAYKCMKYIVCRCMYSYYFLEENHLPYMKWVISGQCYIFSILSLCSQHGYRDSSSGREILSETECHPYSVSDIYRKEMFCYRHEKLSVQSPWILLTIGQVHVRCTPCRRN